MDRSKLARAAALLSFAACALSAACGGRVGDDVDERARLAAGASSGSGTAAPKPAQLACPNDMKEGASCGAVDRTCTDESSCSEPVYRCVAGAWHVVSESSCARTTQTPCPDAAPAEDEWCFRPLATCSYVDRCSQRPAGVPSEREYECTGERGSRWTLVTPSYEVTCPASLPANGSACEPECRVPGPCAYTTPCGTSSAVCEPRSATWHVTGATCPGDAGGGD